MPYGEITRWDSSRGYGFINDHQAPQARGQFVHITAFDGLVPSVGESYSYNVVDTKDGRTKAVDLVPLTAAREEVDRVFGRDD